MRSNGERRAAPAVVITGASAGIGRATALAFAQRGWSVGLIARGRERLESAAQAVERAGGRAVVLQADVADPEAVEEAAAHASASFGGIDVWVNNAMATIYSPIAGLSPAEVKRVTEVTYLGQVHGTLAALRHMRPRERGTIVQVGSALAYRSIPLQSAYCAAKAAVRGFTDCLRSELLHEGSAIRVTMVQLPAVDTPQFDWARTRLPRRLQPVPPIHAPEPVAEAIVRAALEAPRELWVGGPTVQAILGTMTVPGLLDGMMARRAWPGQMTEERARPRPDNLFEPPPGDPGVHGRFGRRSRQSVSAVSETTARGVLALAFLGTFAGAAAAAWRLGAAQRTRGSDCRLPRRQRTVRFIA
jgi:NAD(P)-dependent dehydrogenase (short-subunit alcohol dehydrogenase family)